MQDFALLENTLTDQDISSLYTNPVCDITVQNIHDIPQAFEAIETCHKEGLYLVGYISYEFSYALYPKLHHLLEENTSKSLLHFTAYKKRKDMASNQAPLHFNINKDHIATTKIPKLLFKQSYQEYEQAFEKIVFELTEGNSYQINYTSNYQLPANINAKNLYFSLRNQQLAGFCAYLKCADTTLLSFSPELFFKKKGTELTVKPMKGTASRSPDLTQDIQNKNKLQSDEKTKAENLIIVDLLRNDLSKISKTGSVKVENLFTVETYQSLHQMTSTIKSECKENISFQKIIEALFPCGSITGAPKLKTMSTIQEIESGPRGAYTGTIGSIQPNGDMCFNVAIRTLEANQDKINFGVGGGITIDSNPRDEWHEMHLKSKFLRELYQPNFELIESLYYSNDTGYRNFELHLNRLQKSAHTLAFHDLDIKSIEHKLLEYSREILTPLNEYKVRISISISNQILISHAILENKNTANSMPLKFRIDNQEINQGNILFQHKTTSKETRGFMDENFVMTKKTHPDIDTLIYMNQKGNLTEARYHNLIVQEKETGIKYTPKTSDGVLPGIHREKLVSSNIIIEKSLTLKDLKNADRIWLCNDVRGMQLAELIEEKTH